MKNIQNWIKIVKVILWVSLIGFGVTLVNTTSLLFTTNEMLANVRIDTKEVRSLPHAQLKPNAGTLTFRSEQLLDRVLFKHVYGYHDLLQSLFTFTVCGLLLVMISHIDTADPFTTITARHITWMGILYIAYGVITIAAAAYMAFRVQAINHSLTSAYPGFREDLSNIKIGAFILIFSLIYRTGITLQEDNRLTI
ncbi:DUF2975 domain-containing protein [Mucilaginibacter daejeonensis]|uniref:DUF2975 domain-containing protein n=1 Tax=Mucilaginibacter daejeonensis TaxID=398049 RepID=UPI001D175DD9|nr:DUF2975 domain-containing protein [Mucilaginibacter daejeonensis]UEG52101.1 DUF2975 domain-containing protein [Mucilaginibacter daejeonensis]